MSQPSCYDGQSGIDILSATRHLNKCMYRCGMPEVMDPGSMMIAGKWDVATGKQSSEPPIYGNFLIACALSA